MASETVEDVFLRLRRELADAKRALAEATHERDDARESLSRRLELRRELEQALGVGPYMGADEAMRVALAAIARMRTEAADARADAASWREQCETAREDALRYGRERDEARRLPVLRTCGGCRHYYLRSCEHPSVMTPGRAIPTEHDAAPPSWCPLRGAA